MEQAPVTFIGVKLLMAQPMTRQQYLDYRHWPLPADELGSDEGYLVEYLDGGAANHPNHASYISWSPKDVFERSYRPTAGLTFGLAIEAAKLGRKIARAGWNGKGMWVCMGQGHPALAADAFWNAHTREHAIKMGGTAKVQPYMIMKTAQEEIQMGWLASQSDMLAEDWQIVE